VTLSFLESAMQMNDSSSEFIVGISGMAVIAFTILFGRLSDRIGRKAPIVWAYTLTLLLLFPAFWIAGAYANPGLAEAANRMPIVISGPNCTYNPFMSEQPTRCAKLLGDLSGTGVAFKHEVGANLAISVGGRPIPLENYSWADKALRGKQLHAWLAEAGYHFGKVRPSPMDFLIILATRVALAVLLGASFGATPALLTEIFPPRIRYSSMSIPYHIGNGYFGGFLPLVAAYIVARTGDPYAGLWYTWIIVAIALVVALWGLKGGPPRDYPRLKT
jgi:MFS family permease